MAVALRIENLAGKWQIPLLAISAGLFVAGVLRLRPEVPVVTADDYLRKARVSMQAERYGDASEILTGVLNSEGELTDPQRAAAHRMLAETVWLAESSRTVHNPEHARRILNNFAIAKKLGDAGQEADALKIGQAADWLGDSAGALEAYDKALAGEGADRIKILERMVEILLGEGQKDWARIDGYVDVLLGEAAGDPEALLRAVQWKMQRLLDGDDIEGGKALIRSVEAKLDVPPWSHHLQYFQALILYREQQLEAAEGRLRALQANLRRGNSLYAQAGWLLGKINYLENRPEIALSFYDEIVHTHAGSEYGLASLLGRAESLAALERYAAAAESYAQVIDAIGRSRGSLLLDQVVIRESLRALGEILSKQGRPRESLAFVQTARRLVPAGEEELFGTLAELEARVHVQAGEEYLAMAAEKRAIAAAPAGAMPVKEMISGDAPEAATSEPAASRQEAGTTQPVPQDPRVLASEHFVRAGEIYGELAKLRVLDNALAEEADWESAQCFDRSGRLGPAIKALETYIEHHPNGMNVSQAMHQLGKAQHQAGRIDEAISTYERLLKEFGRTPAALASLVPLARCHMAYGQKGYGRAEEVLLSIVEADPDRPGLFAPAAAEFHEALVELADLYRQWGKPERAIERLEQVLSLYPEDAEITRLEYQLADAYRSSGLTLAKESRETKQQTQVDALLEASQRRLNRARELFDRVASRLDTAVESLTPAEQAYLKASYIYRADCAYDIGLHTEAADLYGRVAWRWQNDPVALSAYVQIVRSYMAAGDLEAARSALARARWILRRIPDSQFNQAPDYRGRSYWADLFDWVERTGLLTG